MISPFGPYYPLNFAGAAWPWLLGGTEEVPTPDPAAKPQADQAVERPSESGYIFRGYSGVPGFDKAPPGNYQTYWEMRKYSAIVLAYMAATGPIFAGSRTVEIRNQTTGEGAVADKPNLTGNGTTAAPQDKRKALSEAVFENQWPDILCGLESLHFGNWTQEIIWDRKLGVLAPVRFKSFMPGEAVLLKDKFGDFAGVKYNQQTLDPQYLWHCVNQPHIDRLVGYARNECARQDWWRAVQNANNCDKEEVKAAGICFLLELATNYSFKDADGKPLVSKEAAQAIIDGFTSARSGVAPRFAFQMKDIIANPALAELSPVKVTQYDWGQTGPAILAAIARLDAIDTRIMRAWSRPEREAMQGQHGTLAESSAQGQVAITDSEKIHADALRQFNQQVFNRFLVTNFGADAADDLYWKAKPLQDSLLTFKQDATKLILSSPTAGPRATAQVDERQLLQESGLPITKNPVSAPMPMTPPAPASGPPRNGNGRANGQQQPGDNRMKQVA